MAMNTEPKPGRRLLWFLLLWGASVLVFTSVLYVLRNVFGALMTA